MNSKEERWLFKYGKALGLDFGETLGSIWWRWDADKAAAYLLDKAPEQVTEAGPGVFAIKQRKHHIDGTTGPAKQRIRARLPAGLHVLATVSDESIALYSFTPEHHSPAALRALTDQATHAVLLAPYTAQGYPTARHAISNAWRHEVIDGRFSEHDGYQFGIMVPHRFYGPEYSGQAPKTEMVIELSIADALVKGVRAPALKKADNFGRHRPTARYAPNQYFELRNMREALRERRKR